MLKSIPRSRYLISYCSFILVDILFLSIYLVSFRSKDRKVNIGFHGH